MSGRNERQIFDGSNRRSEDRRKSGRRKSDKIATLIKYLVVVGVTVFIIKALGF
ncbi:MAG: hypothetical protein ACAH12_09390 [Methylophilaceae bacterium]